MKDIYFWENISFKKIPKPEVTENISNESE